MNPIGFILCLIILQTALILGAVRTFNADAAKKEEAKHPVSVESPGAMPGETLQQLSSVAVPASPVDASASSDDVLPIVREPAVMAEGEYLHPETEADFTQQIENVVSAPDDVGLDSIVLNFDGICDLLSEGEQMDLPFELTT